MWKSAGFIRNISLYPATSSTINSCTILAKKPFYCLLLIHWRVFFLQPAPSSSARRNANEKAAIGCRRYRYHSKSSIRIFGLRPSAPDTWGSWTATCDECCVHLASLFDNCRSIMQQCCKMLRWNVASVWPGLDNLLQGDCSIVSSVSWPIQMSDFLQSPLKLC